MDSFREEDFWYWEKGTPRPAHAGTDAQQILAYASCGQKFLSYSTLPDDGIMANHCALTVMAYEANPND